MEQNNNIPEGIWIEELQSWVKDDYEYSEAAAESIDEFCKDLQKEEGMTRSVTENDAYEEIDNIAFVYTHKAQKLIESEINAWTMLGLQHWPDGDIDIEIHITQYKEL
jgi:hypothetical protein